ncbi:MAG: SurA N-terminal domain-containing protein [Tepidiformaceae bacterium]
MKRRVGLGTLGVLAIVAIAGAAFWEWGGSTAHAPSLSPAELTGAAAVVNGRVITQAAVEQAFEGERSSPDVTVSAVSKAQILDRMVDDELKYEEGVRLHMTPTDAEVDAAIARSREGVEAHGGEGQRAIVEQAAARNGLTYEAYWSSPELRDGWARILTIGNYSSSIFKPSDAYPDANKAVEAKVAALRSKAKVQILVDYK